MVRWQDDWMTKCKWPKDPMKWPNYQITKWPNEKLTNWQNDGMMEWLDVRKLRRRLTVWYIIVFNLPDSVHGLQHGPHQQDGVQQALHGAERQDVGPRQGSHQVRPQEGRQDGHWLPGAHRVVAKTSKSLMMTRFRNRVLRYFRKTSTLAYWGTEW